jgi:hypothetical protein
MHNNPWLYSAYAMKVMRRGGLQAWQALPLERAFAQHFRACIIRFGLINRWPDGSGGMMSHDELIGIAYNSRFLAREIYFYLKQTNGKYINKPEEAENKCPYRFDIRRFPSVMAFISSRAKYPPSYFHRIFFGLDALLNALSNPGEGSRLRMWLMLDEMSQYLFPRICLKAWAYILTKRGEGPKKWFSKYLTEAPIFFDEAPNAID